MWTTVDGMMSTDPHLIDSAKVISELSYDEVAEMAYFGARILHSRMIDPLKRLKIPLRIKNVFKPQQSGTLIHSQSSIKSGLLKAVTAIHGISLHADQSGSLAEISAVVDETLFKSIGSHADVMIASQSSSKSFLCFVIPTASGPDAVHTTQTSLQQRLNETRQFIDWQVEQISLVTIIGAGIDSAPQTIAKIFQSIGDIPTLTMTQGPSHCSLTLIVKPEDADRLLDSIHTLVISNV